IKALIATRSTEKDTLRLGCVYMKTIYMRRRTFLTALVGALAAQNSSVSSREIKFWVAGVRFAGASQWPTTGDAVVLRGERWKGTTAIGVYFRSERIGYVPRSRISAIVKTVGPWRVVRANPRA